MNKMKRILTIVLTLALIVTMMPMNLTNVNARTTTRLSSKKIVLQVGKTKKLKVKNKPAGVKVVWKSSKKKVATVSKKGKVKAKKPGKTTISAKVGKRRKTSTFRFTALRSKAPLINSRNACRRDSALSRA